MVLLLKSLNCDMHGLRSLGLLVCVVLPAGGSGRQQHCNPDRSRQQPQGCVQALLHADDGAMTLQQFILVFGLFELLLSQLPDIHSLRWVNAICTASTIGFAGTTIGVTIYDGNNFISHFQSARMCEIIV